MKQRDVAAVAARLRAVLGAVDSGELEASPVYRARLEGAVVALDAITGGTVDAMVRRLSTPD